MLSRAEHAGGAVVEIPGYSILRTLGQGGMAVVYLALQHSLGREVALKVLSPALANDRVATERFLREARFAAKLQHPNIVAVHDVGSHGGLAYMAIAYEPGGSLADLAAPLEVDRARRVVRDVANALDYAHRRGVVHRDVKPHNILLRDDGSSVLGDFGIALALEPQTRLTDRDTSVGTPHYMSPEQLQGKAIDGRSDLYSLGIVLYQLLVGRLPFDGPDGWSIGMQHLSAEVPRLPQGLAPLQALVDAMLAKDPRERPQDGADVVRRLDSLLPATAASPVPSVARPWRRLKLLAATVSIAVVAVAAALLPWPRTDAPASIAAPQAPVAARRPSIAVLPFVDMSESQDQSYFSDGIAEELSNVLAKLPQLDVASRTSAFSFKGRPDDLTTIGRKLKVAHILEGSVRTSGERIRVTAQLIEVESGFHLWSETYDRELTDIFALQDEIAAAVVVALKLRLLPGQLSEERAPVAAEAMSSDARARYARGLEAAAKEDWVEVRREMEESLAAQPTPAHRIRLYGMRFEPYVPALFAGLAAYRLGDCDATLKAFDEPRTRSVLTHPVVARRFGDEIRTLSAASVDCRSRAAKS